MEKNQNKISRRRFLGTIAAGAALASLPVSLLSSSPKKPNIIFIQCDSMDGRSMHNMGHPAAYTPNLDRLAARGTLFRNTYCNSPLCTPSRASLYSGKFVHQIDAWNNNRGLDPDYRTYRQVLEDTGYTTFFEGKNDYTSGGHTLGARLGAWLRSANIRVNMRGRPTARVIEPDTKKVKEPDWKKMDTATAWLKENARKKNGKPFMLYVGLTFPHPAYRSSHHWLSKIDPEKVRIPPFEEHLHPVIEYSSIVKGTYAPYTTREIRDIRRTYLAMIAEVDEIVGSIVDTAHELGLDDNTYIIFSSDHGDMTLEHRLTHKQTLYEGAARVPLIIAGPGVRKNVQVNNLVSLVDLYPTFMDMAGLPQQPGMMGRSLMPLLKTGIDEDRPDWVFSEYHGDYQNTGSFMLRKEDWKYVVFAGYEPQLFNLRNDPDEMINLAKSRPDKVEKMDGFLRRIVDYYSVDKRAKAYDKASFLDWRARQTPESYKEAMNDLYQGKWIPEIDSLINKWLKEK